MLTACPHDDWQNYCVLSAVMFVAVAVHMVLLLLLLLLVLVLLCAQQCCYCGCYCCCYGFDRGTIAAAAGSAPADVALITTHLSQSSMMLPA